VPARPLVQRGSARSGLGVAPSLQKRRKKKKKNDLSRAVFIYLPLRLPPSGAHRFLHIVSFRTDLPPKPVIKIKKRKIKKKKKTHKKKKKKKTPLRARPIPWLVPADRKHQIHRTCRTGISIAAPQREKIRFFSVAPIFHPGKLVEVQIQIHVLHGRSAHVLFLKNHDKQRIIPNSDASAPPGAHPVFVSRSPSAALLLLCRMTAVDRRTVAELLPPRTIANYYATCKSAPRAYTRRSCGEPIPAPPCGSGSPSPIPSPLVGTYRTGGSPPPLRL